MFYKYKLCPSLVNMFFIIIKALENIIVYHPLWSEKRKLCQQRLTANDEKHMRAASFISGHCVMLRHFFPFTPFDPDLSSPLWFYVRLHTINVCHLLRDHKKQPTPSWQGLHWQPLSPCIWATRSSTGGTGTSSLIISSTPPSTSPLEVMLITWIPTDWHGWRTRRWNPYFMHFAWVGN